MGKVEHRTQEEYIKGWTDTMVDIWKEKIVKYSIIDSGSLMNSVTGSSSQDSALLKFVSYGIYQAYGVGNGYKHDNGGNLEFLDPEYRKRHKLGRPRQRRNWYTPRLYSSVMVMQRAMAEIYSHDIVNTICDALTDGRAALK